ncbi:hypothetical protein ACQ4M4_19290 [Leptolyngbya sp. AN02str]|uniref:hypothetical protein n=1 Tax=Leptolyngbya sp. AN02str TaxID=3423363 RepID=UPI003D315436
MLRKIMLTTAAIATVLSGLSVPASAQMAEVPSPNRNGDYTTAVMRGNRGNTYQVTRWLVVDPDPTYLNCRATPNGRVQARLAPGTLLRAVFEQNDAVIRQNGSPWLRVRPSGGSTVGETSPCYVRANRQYIAPINGDSWLDVTGMNQ